MDPILELAVAQSGSSLARTILLQTMQFEPTRFAPYVYGLANPMSVIDPSGLGPPHSACWELIHKLRPSKADSLFDFVDCNYEVLDVIDTCDCGQSYIGRYVQYSYKMTCTYGNSLPTAIGPIRGRGTSVTSYFRLTCDCEGDQ